MIETLFSKGTDNKQLGALFEGLMMIHIDTWYSALYKSCSTNRSPY